MANPGTNIFPDTDDAWAGAAGTAYDVYADPIGTNPTTDPDHADQHTKTNRGLTKVEKRLRAIELKDQVSVTRTVTATGAGGTLTNSMLSLTIPANKAFVGMQLRWEAWGSIDLTVAAQTWTAKQAFGAQALGTYSFPSPAAGGAVVYPWLTKQWVMRGSLLILALGAAGTGSARGAIDGWFDASSGTAPIPFVSILGNSSAIDTTVSNNYIVSLTFQNSAAVGGSFNAARVSIGSVKLERSN